MFRTGQTIGQYTLIQQLGRGGFGEVWLAEKRTKFVTTRVAVKLPLDEQVDHETIKHEATLWQQASGHPNILPIIDADEYDGQIVIVSEYAPDGSLEQLLKTHGKLEIKQAVEMTVGILNGLEFLHSRNIIHRDLKPANILLQGTTPRLADFGISRAMRTTMTSQSGKVVGTFAYMSPEALDGKRSVQTDIWAVGVNLYQFLTGKLPFPQKEPSQLFAAIIMHTYKPLIDFAPSTLAEIINKALSKMPEDRYRTAGQMREDLTKVLVNISFSQFAVTERLLRGIVPEVTVQGENLSEETLPEKTLAENPFETIALQSELKESEKKTESIIPLTENHPSVTKPSYLQDLMVTQATEKEFVITQVPAKEPTAKVLFSEALSFNDDKAYKKENNYLFVYISAGGLLALFLMGIIGYNFNSSAILTTNKNSNAANAETKAAGSTSKALLPNGVEMSFAYIPAGEFQMGSATGADNEKPVHTVKISQDFWMQQTEVTQSQWKVVMGAVPSKCDDGKLKKDFLGDLKPVICVSWSDAQSFVSKMNSKNDGYEYRLPNEAEWEYTARAGSKSDSASNLNETAWYYYNSREHTHEVGMKQANAWNLYDMQGNVWEWCQDWYGDYSSETVTNPIGKTEDSNRGVRGGGWQLASENLRLTIRNRFAPSNRFNDLGFRLVRTAK